MTLGIYVLHTQFDDPEVTRATVAAVQADVNGWGKAYVICNGKGDRELAPIKGAAIIRHFVPATDVAVMVRAIQSYPTDVMILLKSGVMVQPGMTARLVTALSDTTIGIVAPTLFRMDDSVITGEGITDAVFVRDWCWGFTREFVTVVGYADWVGNAFRDCPGADVDYCYRAREHGYRVVQVSEAMAALPDKIDERWQSKAYKWLVWKHGLVKINEVW